MFNENDYLMDLIKRYPVLKNIREEIWNAYEILKACYISNNKLLIAGNGGSCADSQHIVGELMKGFVKSRPVSEEFAQKLIGIDSNIGLILSQKLQMGLPAVDLNSDTLASAVSNDTDGYLNYAQHLHALGQNGDVFLGISTSGNSKNVYYAAVTSKALGMKVIGLTGKTGGVLKDISDIAIVVPEFETYKIQELHLPIYHTLCLMLESYFFYN